MFDRFKIHLKSNFHEIEGKNLLLAISGGIDSIVMLDLFSQLGTKHAMAHCNFKLRGEASDLDESFVRETADQYAWTLHVKQFNTLAYAEKHHCSVQMAARTLRYDWFDNLLETYNYDYLLTAHHAGDHLETFLINLSRGTGLDGLCGIPEKKGHLARPLLLFQRDEIHNYALQRNLIWREDLSNLDGKYLRNKIRHKLVPVLRELNPSFNENFKRTLENLQGSRDLIQNSLNELKKEVIEVNTTSKGDLISFKVNKLKPYIENSAYLHHLFHPYGFKQLDDIRSLMTAQSGKILFSNTHRLVKHGDLLLLKCKETVNKDPSTILIDEFNQSVELNGMKLAMETLTLSGQVNETIINRDVHTACFDKELLRFPLKVRKWKKGDYFYPFGMKGKKKLSKYFKDEKYSLFEKENIWLLCSGNDIIWILGKRMDDRYKITEHSKTLFKVTLYT